MYIWWNWGSRRLDHSANATQWANGRHESHLVCLPKLVLLPLHYTACWDQAATEQKRWGWSITKNNAHRVIGPGAVSPPPVQCPVSPFPPGQPSMVTIGRNRRDTLFLVRRSLCRKGRCKRSKEGCLEPWRDLSRVRAGMENSWEAGAGHPEGRSPWNSTVSSEEWPDPLLPLEFNPSLVLSDWVKIRVPKCYELNRVPKIHMLKS